MPVSERRSRLRRKSKAQSAALQRSLLPTSTRDALSKAAAKRDREIAEANREYIATFEGAKERLAAKRQKANREFNEQRDLILRSRGGAVAKGTA
jgi:hypothetical protein